MKKLLNKIISYLEYGILALFLSLSIIGIAVSILSGLIIPMLIVVITENLYYIGLVIPLFIFPISLVISLLIYHKNN